jgi:hypothetical protein
MDRINKKIDYTTYNFEDFLQDDFFINSILHPTDDNIIFWTGLLKDNKQALAEFEKAKLILQAYTDNQDDIISNNESAALWDKIETSVSRLNKKTSRKKLLSIAGIAASIAILCLTIAFFSYETATEEDKLLQFAQSEKPSTDSFDAIQLYLSDQKIIALDNKESDIKYESNGITIDENKLLQEEEAIDTYNQLIVPRGKRSRLTLSDGTSMYVNSGTRVIYPSSFSNKKREIYVDGEIYIEVKPDQSSPFLVKTDDMQIKVLGTKFNVKSYKDSDQKQVVLVNGSVSVNNKSEETILTPNDLYELTNAGKSIKKINVNEYISWINGVYYLKEERLDILFDKLSDYYGVKIGYDPEVKLYYSSGKLDMKDNLKEILEGLTFSFPIRISSSTDNEFKITIIKD